MPNEVIEDGGFLFPMFGMRSLFYVHDVTNYITCVAIKKNYIVKATQTAQLGSQATTSTFCCATIKITIAEVPKNAAEKSISVLALYCVVIDKLQWQIHRGNKAEKSATGSAP